MSDTVKKVYRYLSWDEIQMAVDDLVAKIRTRTALREITTLLVVTRGGMVPAGLILQQLDLDIVHTIRVKSYSEFHERVGIGVPHSTLGGVEAGSGEHIVVIDDVYDSGETVELLRRYFPKAFIACLYVKGSTSRISPGQLDAWSGLLPADHWVVFPWEEDVA